MSKSLSPFQFSVSLVILTRVITFVGALIGLWYIPFKYSFPYVQDILLPYKNPLLWSWANFDGVHYLLLSQNGYVYDLTQAFFPLYMLMIRFGNFVVNNPIITGLIISHTFFLASLVMFYKLLQLDYEENIVRKTLLMLVVFPTSYYFLSVYTESLFFFLLITCFYFMRKKQFLAAGLIGILLTLTRIVGIFIIPSLLYEIYLAGNKKKLIYGLLPTLGIASYMVYLGIYHNDPLKFIHVQSSFGAGRDTANLILFPQVVYRYLKMVTTMDTTNPIYPTIWLELLSSLTFAGLLIKAYLNKIRLSYLVFALPAFILPTLTGNFSSMPRYVLMCFPAFIVLAMLKNKWISTGIIIFSSIFLGILTAFFTRGYWIS